MAKAKLNTGKTASGTEALKDTKSVKLTQKQKKKKFWKKHPKKATSVKEDKKVSPLIPPKIPEYFSSNWKALQELLKPNVSTTTAAAAASTSAPTNKKGQKDTDKKPTENILNKGGIKLNGELKAAPSEAEQVKKSPKEEKKAEEQKRKKRKINIEKEEKHEEGGNNKKIKESNNKKAKEGNNKKAKEGNNKKAKEGNNKKAKEGNNKKAKEGNNKKAKEGNNVEPPKVDIWFDDVDPDDIEAAMGPEAGKIAREMQGKPENKSSSVEVVLVKERAFEGLTKTVAMDCEMVGVGHDGEESILARVSIVNQFGKCVYDKYVKPTEKVTDYRTAVSGIRPQDIKKGEEFKVVQKEVSEIIKGRILVGHALHNDLKILFLDHPRKATRDTQRYKPFKQIVKSGRPSLKLLCETILNVKVQSGEHCSIQDAQAAMRLYTMEKKQWEAAIKAKYSRPDPQKKEKPAQ
ncbi:RNA exonuclease 4 [Discoglossus pictus]